MDLVGSRAIPVSGLLRAARAVADVSQRGLAERSGVSKSAICRMEQDETGERTTLATFVRAMSACGLTVTVHANGRQLRPDDDPERDRARRRFPPHLEPHVLEREMDWWAFTRMHWLVPRTVELPSRVYHVSPWWRERWRRRQAHPWSARFWEDTAHLAPEFTVHPQIAARRRAEEMRQEWIRRWVEKTTGQRPGTARDVIAQEPASGAGDGGADEARGDIAEADPRGCERLGEE